jgi:hypothetical protein
MKESSFKLRRRKYRLKFPNTTCPFEHIISKLVKKVGTRGILIGRKPLEGKNVLTEDKLDDLSRRLENTSRGFLLRLALQSVVSVGSMWTATKLLHIRPYKITVEPEIKSVDYGKREVF